MSRSSMWVMDNIKEEYKKLAIKSLKEDMDKWIITGDGCMDMSWTWYQSPTYKNGDYSIEFWLDDKFINTSLTVRISGKDFENLSLILNPFSELYTLLCIMKKHIVNKSISKREETISNAIKV